MYTEQTGHPLINRLRRKSLSNEQMKVLLATTRELQEYRTLHQVSSVILHTGVTCIDLVSTRWTDVNFVRRRMVIRKHGASWPRYIPFGHRTEQMLIELRSHTEPSGYVLGKSGWTTLSHARKQWRLVCEEIGIEAASMWVLRGTFIRQWIDARLCMDSLGRILGVTSYFANDNDRRGPEELFGIDARFQERFEKCLYDFRP